HAYSFSAYSFRTRGSGLALSSESEPTLHSEVQNMYSPQRMKRFQRLRFFRTKNTQMLLATPIASG
ncbi:hypothetical protein A2U01_0079945, partial [Trifolium medium]|nr:hypothetical protein [Trifolium medium]